MNSFSNLLANGAVMLSASELKLINGSGGYTCYCGHTGGPNESLTMQVEADSLEEALTSTNYNCGMIGATCSGN